MSTRLHPGAMVELVEDAYSATSGTTAPPVPAGTRAEVTSSHWEGGIRRVCIETLHTDEAGYRLFAIVDARHLAPTEESTLP